MKIEDFEERVARTKENLDEAARKDENKTGPAYSSEAWQEWEAALKEHNRAKGELASVTGEEYVVDYHLGCSADSSSVALQVLMQSTESTFIIFPAYSHTLNQEGFYEDLGLAIVECRGCSLTKFGYPNEEGQEEHPLWLKGLKDCDGVGEVINSSWKAALEHQMDTSARRIWGKRYYKSYNVPEGGQREWTWKHFILVFHERIFECIADELVLTLSNKSFDEVLAEVGTKLR